MLRSYTRRKDEIALIAWGGFGVDTIAVTIMTWDIFNLSVGPDRDLLWTQEVVW